MTPSSSTKVGQGWWPVQRVRQRDNESTFSPFVCLGPPWTGSCPATVSRAVICFTQMWISFRSTLTNTPRSDVSANTCTPCGPVKLTPEISCHTPKWKQMSLVYSHHTPWLAKISKDGCRSLDLCQRKRVYLSPIISRWWMNESGSYCCLATSMWKEKRQYPWRHSLSSPL